MVGASLRRGPGLAFTAWLLGACAQIIGISSYEIDPELDRAGTGGGAGQGDFPLEAGARSGGRSSLGGVAGETFESPNGGEGGSGEDGNGEDGNGGDCQATEDCDDAIDCTLDSCGTDGACTHQPDSSLCVPDVGECLTCKAGLGCVSGNSSTQELLLDTSFDSLPPPEHWIEYSETRTSNIFPDTLADTPPNLVKLGPALANATVQEYADLLQSVSVPAKAVRLTFSGYYKLKPGGLANDAADSTVAALYEVGELSSACKFHTWRGTDTLQAAWKSFSYDAPKDQLQVVLGKDVSFDLVTYSWNSVFSFDTVSLVATLCEE